MKVEIEKYEDEGGQPRCPGCGAVHGKMYGTRAQIADALRKHAGWMVNADGVVCCSAGCAAMRPVFAGKGATP